MITHIELKKLSCADKVTCRSNVRIRWGSVAAFVFRPLPILSTFVRIVTRLRFAVLLATG
jgi:hypothetical protein